MTDEVSPVPSPAEVAAQVADRMFTQAEVNEIIQSRAKYMKAEYEHLQANAAAAGDLDSHKQRLASNVSALQLENLRRRVASEFGMSAEDWDVLLTAKDEESLRTQAERFVNFAPQRSAGGNVAHREGCKVAAPPEEDGGTRALVSELFGNDEIWDLE